MAEMSGSATDALIVGAHRCRLRSAHDGPRRVNVHVDYNDDGDEATNFIEFSTAKASASSLSYIEVKRHVPWTVMEKLVVVQCVATSSNTGNICSLDAHLYHLRLVSW